jgi:hypothetical protein
MTLDGSELGGAYKMAYCNMSNLAAFQWHDDSKVVNVVSSYLNFDIGMVQRKVGSGRRSFPCPQAIIHFQQDMGGGVGQADHLLSRFGAFAAQSHFKKWYKNALMAVLDCMVFNGLHIWNMSTEEVSERNMLERHEFMQVLAHELMHYSTQAFLSPRRMELSERRGEQERQDEEGKDPHNDSSTTSPGGGAPQQLLYEPISGQRCAVCQLEVNQVVLATARCSGQTKRAVGSIYSGLRKNLARCQCREACVTAHSVLFAEGKGRIIHSLFPGKTCMEIAHSRTGRAIWKPKLCAGRRGEETKVRVAVNYKHPVIVELRRLVENSFCQEACQAEKQV